MHLGLGELHEQHASNPRYTREDLRDILVSLKPQSILLEWPEGAPLRLAKFGYPLIYDRYPSGWAAFDVELHGDSVKAQS